MNNPVVKFFYLLWYLPVLVLSTIVLGSLCVIVSYFSIRAARYLTNIMWGHVALDPAGLKLQTIGLENLPEGPYIVASNHLAFCDSIFIPLAMPRTVNFLAKSDYFTTPGVKGRAMAAFRRCGQRMA